ncbi:MAG: SPOR domain-containing protein [Deltaproteobacteria bacterium]|nr:SPOR domain-containing protein [Deltaproteobacteria bacterium]
MGTPQGKTTLKTISAMAAAALVAAIIMLPSCKKDEPSEEVISKRVRIGLQEEAPKAPPAEGQPEAEAPEAGAEKADAKPAEPAKEVAAAKPADTVKAPVEPKKTKAAETKAEPVAERKADETKKEPVKKAEARLSKEEKARDARQSWLEKVAKAGKALAKKPYAVNVASFPSMREAQSLLKSLKASGYTAYTTEFTKDGVKWYRVRVGFYKSREEASKVGDKLEAKYNIQSPWIVKPAREEAAGHIK